jgi:hypothetical protein
MIRRVATAWPTQKLVENNRQKSIHLTDTEKQDVKLDPEDCKGVAELSQSGKHALLS